MKMANITPSTQAAGSVPAVEREQERIAFKDAHRHLELDEVPDAWGRPMFKHSHVEASWLGWIARAALAKWGQPAQAAEPVAWLDPWTGTKVTTDYDAYGKHGIPLYTAHQPVAREPLTPEQIAEMMRDTWGCASIAPRHAPEFARAVERAHGITKGGQHVS